VRTDRKPPSIDAQLDRATDKLDQLKAEVSGGIRSQSHFDALEERARGIATGIVAAFRGDWRQR